MNGHPRAGMRLRIWFGAAAGRLPAVVGSHPLLFAKALGPGGAPNCQHDVTGVGSPHNKSLNQTGPP